MRYFINKSFLTEMRIVMFVIVKGGIINFKVFNDQKLWEMIRNLSGISRSGSTPENSLKKKTKFLKIVVYTYGLFNWFDEL